MATAEGQPNGTEGYARITSHRTVHVRKLNREMATYIYSKVVRSTCDVTTFPTLLLFPTLPSLPFRGWLSLFIFPPLPTEEIYIGGYAICKWNGKF